MLGKYLCGLMLLAPIYSFGQTNTLPKINEVPILRGANLPMYPPLAEAAHITGEIAIQITVKSGKVIDTKILRAEVRNRSREVMSEAGGKWLLPAAIENVKSWRFDSSVDKLLMVHYTYAFAGTATDNLTNPQVEISPSLDVKIIARPVKPIELY